MTHQSSLWGFGDDLVTASKRSPFFVQTQIVAITRFSKVQTKAIHPRVRPLHSHGGLMYGFSILSCPSYNRQIMLCTLFSIQALQHVCFSFVKRHSFRTTNALVLAALITWPTLAYIKATSECFRLPAFTTVRKTDAMGEKKVPLYSLHISPARSRV